MTIGKTEVDTAFLEVEERRRASAEHDAARRILWRTHHWPHRYERCLTVGGRHVCRRCFWFYVVSFAVLAAAFAGFSPWPPTWDIALVWVLSLPATADFIGGELGLLRYEPRRQTVVTIVLAAAVGRGFHAELTDRWSWTFWGPVLVFGTSWFIAAVIGWRRQTGQYSPER